jgi:GDP-4-dehydro-6-deoxy-D-mannose reductase
MKKRILVTGATGFIGKELVLALEAQNHVVTALSSAQGDIAEPATLSPLASTAFDHIFHLAGKTFVPASWQEPASFLKANVDGTRNVLEFCRLKKISLTYVSAYLYGIPSRLPIKESDPVTPNNPYALSKQLAENLCLFYANHFDVPVSVARPFNIYGIGQKAPFLIPEIIEQIELGQSIRVKDLKPKRDYLYVKDLVSGLIATMNAKPGHHCYNFGSGVSLSVQDIIEAAQRASGTNLAIVSENVERKNEIPDVVADISKATAELGWKPKYAFSDGLKEIIAEMRRSHV